jgi:hypothetical protein
MNIKVNGSYIFEVNEKELTVKNRKLYNLKTKSYEGVESDIATFEVEQDGKTIIKSGPIQGYTYNGHVVIRPNCEYNGVKIKTIDHVSSVVALDNTALENDEELKLMTEI